MILIVKIAELIRDIPAIDEIAQIITAAIISINRIFVIIFMVLG